MRTSCACGTQPARTCGFVHTDTHANIDFHRLLCILACDCVRELARSLSLSLDKCSTRRPLNRIRNTLVRTSKVLAD